MNICAYKHTHTHIYICMLTSVPLVCGNGGLHLVCHISLGGHAGIVSGHFLECDQLHVLHIFVALTRDNGCLHRSSISHSLQYLEAQGKYHTVGL